jgi:hypothetical protein
MPYERKLLLASSTGRGFITRRRARRRDRKGKQS